MDKADRKEQIIRAAAVVFANKGFHEAAVSDIIAEAGIARGTFYLYFTSKRSIFDHILETVFSRIMAELRPIDVETPFCAASIVEQVSDNARRLAGLVASEQDLFRVLLADSGGLDQEVRTKLAVFYARLAEWTASSLEQGIELGIVRPCNTAIAAHALLGLARGLFLAWVLGELLIDVEALVHEVMALLGDGLLHAQSTSASKVGPLARAARRRHG